MASLLNKVAPRLATDISRPSKIVCIGRNYADHISELNSARPRKPFFFLKPPSSILAPGCGPVVRPKGVDLHYEVELAIALRQRVKDLHPDDSEGAMRAIGHYHVSIDMTARNVQNEAKDKGLPWDIAKGFDTFLPLSAIIPKSSIKDPYQTELWLNINGQKRQEDQASLMLFNIPRILSEISRVMTLEEGDLVLTGTPKGVGPVHDGDRIEAGLRYDGIEIVEGRIDVTVADSHGDYEYKET